MVELKLSVSQSSSKKVRLYCTHHVDLSQYNLHWIRMSHIGSGKVRKKIDASRFEQVDRICFSFMVSPKAPKHGQNRQHCWGEWCNYCQPGRNVEKCRCQYGEWWDPKMYYFHYNKIFYDHGHIYGSHEMEWNWTVFTCLRQKWRGSWERINVVYVTSRRPNFYWTTNFADLSSKRSWLRWKNMIVQRMLQSFGNLKVIRIKGLWTFIYWRPGFKSVEQSMPEILNSNLIGTRFS